MTLNWRWFLVALIVFVLMAIVWGTFPAGTPPAEAAAIAHIELNGFCTGGESFPSISALTARVTGGPVTVRPKTVGFPRNRMDDRMVEHLLSIRGLGAIMLFPRDADGHGYDTLATSISSLNSLSDLDLPASPRFVTTLQERYPTLILLAADRPRSEGRADKQIASPK